MKKYAPHHKTAWEWHINGKNANNIVKLIYPFSIVKREQLKKAKEFYDNSI